MGAYRKFEDYVDDPAALASVLDWWRDAGVDVLVEDVPRDWFAAPVADAPIAAPARTATPAAPSPAPMPDAHPETLADFLAWRIGEQAPENDWRGVSIAASGPTDAAVMILVDCPERDDEGALMGGDVGKLFDRMLAAIGLDRDTVHLAAVCARRPVAGRMPPETAARLSDLAHAHVALVAPKRLLVMGNAASRAILGTELPSARGRLHSFNHKQTEVAVVASFHPRFLLEKPAAKAEAWKDLQLLMGGMSA